MLEEQADKIIDEVRQLRTALKQATVTTVPGTQAAGRHQVNLADGLVLVAMALERIGGALERLASVVEQANRE